MTRTLQKLDTQAYPNSQDVFDEVALTVSGGATPSVTSNIIKMDDDIEQHILYAYSAGNAVTPATVECQYYINDTSGWVTRDTFNLADGNLSTNVYNFGQDAIRFQATNNDAGNPCSITLHLRCKKTT